MRDGEITKTYLRMTINAYLKSAENFLYNKDIFPLIKIYF